jgi:hypothetical protein
VADDQSGWPDGRRLGMKNVGTPIAAAPVSGIRRHDNNRDATCSTWSVAGHGARLAAVGADYRCPALSRRFRRVSGCRRSPS